MHFAREREGLLYVTALGQDQVFVYRKQKNGTLVDTRRRLVLPPGYGPCHLEFHPEHPGLIYVLCELAGKMVVFRNEEGYFLLQEIDTLPEHFKGENISAAVKRSGDLLFASNRGHDSIASFRIQEDGTLERTGIFPSGGKTPRDFEIFGNVLVVANQDSDSLTVLKLDRRRGTRSLTDLQAEAIRPCFVSPFLSDVSQE